MTLQTTRGPAPHGGRPVLAAGAPAAEAAGAMILLHGRGGSADDILSLASYFGRDDITYLAPEAAGHVWYPERFMQPRRLNEPYLSAALANVAALADDLNAAGIPDDRIVLLGFSQGACLALESAMRRPRRYGGVVALSGGLIGADDEVAEAAPALAGTPALFGCAEMDAHIPLARVELSAARFAASGAEVTKRIYRGSGHGVNDDEIGLIRTLLTGLAA
ncbi:MAG: alpha/beta fold hydrolase [Rhizobiales bacterium]|nr:alpha/beta fold hydrolase [Hyphomicrobiales bacterium]